MRETKGLASFTKLKTHSTTSIQPNKHSYPRNREMHKKGCPFILFVCFPLLIFMFYLQLTSHHLLLCFHLIPKRVGAGYVLSSFSILVKVYSSLPLPSVIFDSRQSSFGLWSINNLCYLCLCCLCEMLQSLILWDRGDLSPFLPGMKNQVNLEFSGFLQIDTEKSNQSQNSCQWKVSI